MFKYKGIIFVAFFVFNFALSQTPVSVEDLNKINGSKVAEKPMFLDIEANLKNMEDNILKLMRELGELKMQINKLKESAKDKNITPEVAATKKVEQDIVVTITSSNSN